MSCFSTKVRGLLAVAAMGGALAAAAPAGAITLLSADMDRNYTAMINGPVVNVNAYIGPVTFTTDGNPVKLTAYCVDIFHDMFLGPLNNGNGYAYHDEDLETDSSTSTSSGQSGLALTGQQLQDISRLLNLSLRINLSDPDYAVKRAGIQGAIWEIENPGYTVTPAQTAVATYMHQFESTLNTMSVGQMKTIYANDWATQAFAYGIGVPEPATWTMMILGFGGMGAMLRRRRMAVATA